MAHRFDNFDDAFAALSSNYYRIKIWHDLAYDYAEAAYIGCPDPVDRAHFYDLYSAVQSLRTLLYYLADIKDSIWDHSYLYASIYWGNKDVPAADPYELTLINMIWAYLDAPDDARSAQRLLFDAYKASMYDKPFDLEYHTRWVERFKSWE